MTPDKNDWRQPITRAFDDWLESAEGCRSANPVTISLAPCHAEHLRARLQLAFLAGAMAQWSIAGRSRETGK